MYTVDSRSFEHLVITIETKTAVENIYEILEQGFLLTDLTIGRSDLSGSMGIKDVEAEIITDIFKKVAHKALEMGLRIGMGSGARKKNNSSCG